MQKLKNRSRRAAALAVAAATFFGITPIASADDSVPSVRLSGEKSDAAPNAPTLLSARIVKNESALMRLTSLFRLNNPRETGLHRAFVAATSTVAYAVVDAGNIVTFTNAYRYHSMPQNFSVGRAETGPFLIFLGELGYFTRTTGAVLLDLAHAQSVKSKGFDRATFERKASDLQAQTQDLLKKRRELVAASGNQTDLQEQKVLEDIATNASAEFVTNYARASRLKAFRIGQNTIQSYSSATGAFWGGLLEYLAAVHTTPKTTGPAGIGFIVSGTGFIAGDAVGYWGGKLAEKNSKKKMEEKHAVPTISREQLAQDTRALKVSAGGDPELTQRITAYETLSKCFSDHRLLSENENKEMWHRYLHDQIINATEGGANIGAGTVLANAGFGFHNAPYYDPLSQLHRATHFLENFGTSALVFTPTASAGMADTPGEYLYGQWRNHRDTQQGLSPAVILNNRIKALDQVDKLI